MATQYRFVEPSVVAEIVAGPMAAACAVVDVRDEDFVGGHVRGAINWESSRFYEDADLDALINGHLAGKERVVVHCMLSQQRGPRAAARLAARLAERGMQQPAVLVMSGGFQRYKAIYGGDARLVAMDADAAAQAAQEEPAGVGALT